MMRQIFAITLMNLRNIGSRWGTSTVVVVGIAGVVAVLVALLALADGFQSALTSAAKADRALIMRGGSNNEMSSSVTMEELQLISTMSGVAAVSGEIYAVVDVPKKSTNADANLIVRGVGEAGLQVRPEIHIVKGRKFQSGKRDLIAGVGANRIFAGLDVGDKLNIRGIYWDIVGLFESGGSAYESEIWGDGLVVGSALGRAGTLSSLRLQLTNPDVAAALAQQIEADPRLDLVFYTEADYFRQQSENMTLIITRFGYGVAAIMAIGAVFAALNTMYSAISRRTVEIATLRALGFNSMPVIVSVIAESLLLALAGGLLGASLIYLWLDGLTTSTLNNASFSQITFGYHVTSSIILQGLTWAIALGAIGGLFPAIRAARLPITTALRGE